MEDNDGRKGDEPLARHEANTEESKGAPHNTLNTSKGITHTSNLDKNLQLTKHLTKQFASIDENGTCNSCGDTKSMECSLMCLFCKDSFHAVCKDADQDRSGIEVICARSFYNNFNKLSEGINKTRFGTFTFACNACLTIFEQDKVSTSESKVDLIDRRVNNLSQSVDEMKSLLNQIVSLSTPTTTPEPAEAPKRVPSFSEVVEKPLKRSVLILESKSPDDKEEDSKVLDKIISENSIHVDKRYENKKGETVVVCPTEDYIEVLNKKLSHNRPEIKTHQPPDRCPTISVANLSQQYEEHELNDLILQAHPNIKSLAESGETFLVLKVKQQIKNNTRYQATIRVSNSIRKIIEGQGDRLYICSFSCKVFDQFHVKRCNNCQGYGHYKAVCKAKQSSCGYCSKNHHSESCPDKDVNGFLPCCSNCHKNKFDSQKHTHFAFDRSCPSYAAEQKQLRKTISYYDQKNY